jgi:Cu-Zn family superoxide dismutase
MHARRFATFALASLASLACASRQPAGGGAGGAHALLRDASGKEVGTATLAPAGGSVKIDLKLKDLPPGAHAFHVHSVGRCDPPSFESAGPHFNPTNRQHGHQNPQGAHAGDLPNLEVRPDGTAQVSLLAPGLTLGEGQGSLFGKEGTALVVHASPDDGRTDPAGNAGARIACGVIERR